VGSMFRGTGRPQVQLMFDPSHSAELSMVRGILTQHVMETVSAEAFGANSAKYLNDAVKEINQASGMTAADRGSLEQLLGSLKDWNSRLNANPQSPADARPGISMPYDVKEEAITAKGVKYNGYGHSFAGMSVQFILMMGVDAGLVLLIQRRSGIWKRLRAAPISRFAIIGARTASAALIAMFILFVVFGFARLVFQVRVEGSLAGFVGIAAAFSLMTAAFGLLIAVVGKTPEATRGLAILATLLMVMLGGAWVPAFLFPQWLQKASYILPTRWAVDGLDGMTWRGLGFGDAIGPIAVLLGFAIAFGGLAVWRFRWEAPQ